MAPEKSREFIRISQEGIDVLNESRRPGAYWVDFIPFVRYIPHWVPGAAASKLAKRAYPKVIAMKDGPFDAVRSDIVGVLVLDAIFRHESNFFQICRSVAVRRRPLLMT